MVIIQAIILSKSVEYTLLVIIGFLMGILRSQGSTSFIYTNVFITLFILCLFPERVALWVSPLL